MAVLEVKNPAVLNLPQFVNLLNKAFEKGAQVDEETARLEISRLIHHEDLGILVGQEGGEWKSLAILMSTSCKLFPGSRVYHLFNEGSRTLLNLMMSAISDWSLSRGHDKIYAFNANQGRDGAFARMFKAAGRPEVLGTQYVFHLGGE